MKHYYLLLVPYIIYYDVTVPVRYQLITILLLSLTRSNNYNLNKRRKIVLYVYANRLHNIDIVSDIQVKTPSAIYVEYAVRTDLHTIPTCTCIVPYICAAHPR